MEPIYDAAMFRALTDGVDVRIHSAQLIIDADAGAHRQGRAASASSTRGRRPVARMMVSAGNVLAAHQPHACDPRVAIDAADTGVEHHAHATAAPRDP